MKIRTSLACLWVAALLLGFSTGRWSAPVAAWLGLVLFVRAYRDLPAGRGYLPLLVAAILVRPSRGGASSRSRWPPSSG